MVASIIKIVISQNTICDNLVGFPKSGHICTSTHKMLSIRNRKNLLCILKFMILRLASSKAQWSTLVTGRYMITMMVLLCYVNLSGMSFEYIVIVLMNNSLLGGQECTDNVNVQQDGNEIESSRISIIPRLNFTCNGRITVIRARVRRRSNRYNNAFLQVWRPSSTSSTTYDKIDEIQISNDQVTGISIGEYRTTNIILTGNNKIEVQSRDVVGYYRESRSRYRFRTIQTDGYIEHGFDGPNDLTSVNLSNANRHIDEQQPLIQFTIGKCVFNHYSLLRVVIDV